MGVIKYSAAAAAKNMHAIPRFTGGNTFLPEELNYWIGAGIWPAVFIIVALLSILVICCCACARCCCKTPSCMKKSASSHNKCSFYVQFTVLLVAYASVWSALSGSTDVGTGLVKYIMGGVNEFIGNVLDGKLVKLASPLISESLSKVTILRDECQWVHPSIENALDNVQNTLSTVQDDVDNFSTTASDISKTVDDAVDYVTEYDDMRQYAIELTLVIVLLYLTLALINLLFAVYLNCKGNDGIHQNVQKGCTCLETGLRCVSPIMLIIIIAVWIVAAVGLMASTVLSDMCVPSPNVVINKYALQGNSQATLITYYTTCEGPNGKFEEYAGDAYTQIDQTITGAIDEIKQLVQDHCPAGEAAVNNLHDEMETLLEVCPMYVCVCVYVYIIYIIYMCQT